MKKLIDFGIVLGVVAFSIAIAAAAVYPTIKLLQAVE
jgi:hypothetical protein